MRYMLTLLFIVVGVILGVVSAFLEKKEKKILWVITSIAVICTGIIDYLRLDVPAPEIYTLNGASQSENKIYISAEWPLQVYYTTTPYDNPKSNGEKYTGEIDLNETMSISAAARLWPFRWSTVTSKDILISKDGMDVIDVAVPGTSIENISAYLLDNKYFPGTTLSKSDFRVEGKTIAGDNVTLEEFEFSPNVIVEGNNMIVVSYKSLESEVTVTAVLPKLISIEAIYVGAEVSEGDDISRDDIYVSGTYENGEERQITDYSYTTEVFEESNELNVVITANSCQDSILVPLKPKEYLLQYINEIHTPSGLFMPYVDIAFWNKDNDFSIDGKAFESGLKLKIDNWMSNMQGNGYAYAENVQSNIYLAVNQQTLNGLAEEQQYLDGCFVVERNTNGSTTTVEAIVLVDGEERFRTGKITSVTIDSPSFHIPIRGVKQIVIQVNAHSCGFPFILGIIV